MSDFALAPFPFAVGEDVEDLLTAIKGRIQSLCYHVSGTRQCHVLPLSDNGTKGDGFFIDVESLVSTGPGVKDKATPPGEPLVKLGWKVRDRTSGFVGVIEQIIVCFNGCIMVLLVGPPAKDGKVVHRYVDHKLVEKIGAGVSVDAEKPTPRAATGCMMTRAPSRSTPFR